MSIIPFPEWAGAAIAGPHFFERPPAWLARPLCYKPALVMSPTEGWVHIVCLDLEGVLIPEIWIAVAERLGIEGLRLTTRDNPDYDDLMRHRMALLDAHGLKIGDIQQIIAQMAPLDGAGGFVDWIRGRYQLIVLSDTYYELAGPLMRKLGDPTLFCHSLDIEPSGRIAGYRLRQQNPKRHAVRAFKGLNFKVVAAGDSYNDTGMLAEADTGFLFRAPEKIRREFPAYRAFDDYGDLQAAIEAAFARLTAEPVPA